MGICSDGEFILMGFCSDAVTPKTHGTDRKLWLTSQMITGLAHFSKLYYCTFKVNWKMHNQEFSPAETTVITVTLNRH